jgi:hypothetical protein
MEDFSDDRSIQLTAGPNIPIAIKFLGAGMEATTIPEIVTNAVRTRSPITRFLGCRRLCGGGVMSSFLASMCPNLLIDIGYELLF